MTYRLKAFEALRAAGLGSLAQLQQLPPARYREAVVTGHLDGVLKQGLDQLRSEFAPEPSPHQTPGLDLGRRRALGGASSGSTTGAATRVAGQGQLELEKDLAGGWLGRCRPECQGPEQPVDPVSEIQKPRGSVCSTDLLTLTEKVQLAEVVPFDRLLAVLRERHGQPLLAGLEDSVPDEIPTEADLEPELEPDLPPDIHTVAPADISGVGRPAPAPLANQLAPPTPPCLPILATKTPGELDLAAAATLSQLAGTEEQPTKRPRLTVVPPGLYRAKHDNHCWLNSTMTLLFMVDRVRAAILAATAPDLVLHGIQALFAAMETASAAIAPMPLLATVMTAWARPQDEAQQDVSEFLLQCGDKKTRPV